MPTPARTSNEKVIKAAWKILEATGDSGLTMQRVANAVGVKPPSLYKRFQDREAVLRAVVETALSVLAERLERAAPNISEQAIAYRSFAHEYPETFRLIFTPIAPQTALQLSVAPVLQVLERQVGKKEALLAARLFTSWITGFVQMELAGAFRLDGDVEEAFEYGIKRLKPAHFPLFTAEKSANLLR